MRTASRSPVTLKIKFKSSTLDQFIERYSVDISHGGIFIRTKDPLPVGTNLKFEFQLKDASPLITGDGTVVWTRDFDPSRSGVAPGMGVRFDRLPSESQDVLDKILAHKTAKMGKAGEPGFLDTPTKVAFGNVPTRVTPKDVLEELNQSEARRTLLGVGPKKPDDVTPLPPPQPFHGELDEFPDEAFEEATKVAALDALARRSAEAEESNPPPFGKSLEEDVTTERRGRVTPRPRPEESARPAGSDAEPPAAPAPAPPAAVAAPAAAPTFHDLAIRFPFSSDGPPREGSERRPPLELADPFALPSTLDRPGLDDEVTDPRVPPSQRLRIVRPIEPQPAPEPPAPHHAGPVFDEEGPTSAESPPPSVVTDVGPRAAPTIPTLRWIAAAAGVLLFGGVAGFLLLRGKGADDVAGATTTATVASGSGEEEPPAVTAPPPAPVRAAAAPAPTGIAVTIKSAPDGAVAELIGTSQAGPTPMTFRGLVAGQSYRVKISKSGFVAAEVTMKPEAGNPQPIALEAKPAVLRVTSDPAGAQVWINGRRQRWVTPADVRLSSRTAERKQLSLSLRKSGYNPAEQEVALDELVDQGEVMVQEVALVLERRAVRPTPPEDLATPEAGSADDPAPDQAPSESDSGATSTPSNDSPSGDPPADESGKSPDEAAPAPAPAEPETPSGIHNERDPIPDWMKPSP